MGTFLITTYGSNGDVLPFIRLGKALRGRGHEVVLHTHAFYGTTAREAGLRFVPVDTEEAYERTLADAQDLLLNVLADVNHLMEFYRRSGLWEQIRCEYESMAAVVRARGGTDVVAVSRHTSGLSALMLREAFGVPAAWVALSPTLFMAEPLTERLFPRSLAASMNEVRATVGLPPLADWAGWLSSADLRMGLWPAWFDQVGERAPAGAALPGFVLHDDAETGELPAEVAALVDDAVPAARRPVLISGGSGQSLHHEWYRVAAEACARLERPALLVCRHRRLLPDRLPEGVHWQPVLPFRSLMPRVAAVLHHGGVLTSARAIASGVPQLILAHGTDRPDNASRLRRLGLAEWLPAARWTTDAAAALLARVLDDPSYAARARDYAPQIDSPAAVEAAADALEGLLGAPRRVPLLRAGLEEGAPPGRNGEVSMTDSRRERIAQLSPEQRALLARRLGIGTPAPAVRPSPRPPLRAGEQVYDCSPHQRRSWLTAQIDPDGPPVATAIRLRGPLDAAALAAAVDEVVARHDALRTVAVPGDGEPRQRVIGALRVPLHREETAGTPEWTPVEEKIRHWVDRVRGEPFALTSGPLVRAALLRLDERDHVFLLAGHHFVLDAASLGIVLREVATSYRGRVTAGRAGRADAGAAVLAGHPMQYPDVALHHRRMLTDGALHRGIDFWRQALDGLAAPTDLPLPAAPPRPSHRRQGTGEAVRVLDGPLIDRLTAAAGVATRLGLGPALLTAYQLLLARYTGRRDVAVGLFAGGRTEPGTEQVVGDFTNIVVVRNHWADAPAFAAAVRRVSESVAAALAHQDAPFESVVAAVAPPRVPGRPPLVQFGFNLQDYRLQEVDWSGLDATVLPVPAEHTNLDLTLIAFPLDSGAMKIVFEYPADRFAADAVDALATQFHDLLRQLSAAPDHPVWTAVAAAVPEPDALPPAAEPAPAPAPYVPPRTDGEELVAEVFAEVLELSRVGVHDDFFSLGGHSLHAVRLIGRINQAVGLEVPIRAVFRHPTVAALTEALERLVETDAGGFDPGGAVAAAGAPR